MNHWEKIEGISNSGKAKWCRSIQLIANDFDFLFYFAFFSAPLNLIFSFSFPLQLNHFGSIRLNETQEISTVYYDF